MQIEIIIIFVDNNFRSQSNYFSRNELICSEEISNFK